MRETENRVKLASQPKRRAARPKLAPEEEAAMRAAADELEAALGHEVRVRPRGEEVAIEIRFDDLDEAQALARSLARTPPETPSAGRYPPAIIGLAPGD